MEEGREGGGERMSSNGARGTQQRDLALSGKGRREEESVNR